ncbi:MAG: hypothetical protein HY711_07900 [Candidatus Melainabacteria bacterium]|nr:hypothetical protein [Candidatus Melainabacteria bacterium]
MSTKLELPGDNNEPQEDFINPFIVESLKPRLTTGYPESRQSQFTEHLIYKDSITTLANEREILLSNQAFEAALEGLTEQFRAMSETIRRLPPQFRKTVMSSIEHMTGDNYPAYDLFRVALESDK